MSPSNSGDQALAWLDAGQPVDLLFSDVVMPMMSGVELAQIIQARLGPVPVVLATGYSDEVVGGACAQFEILRKPYDSHTLERRDRRRPRQAGAPRHACPSLP